MHWTTILQHTIPFAFQHLSPDEQAQHDAVHNEKGSPSVPTKRPLRNKPSYDPFLLVPCRKFPTRSSVPFDVLIQSETLVVMDTHAHMSTTEVIGLLGGTYLHDSRKLKVIALQCTLFNFSSVGNVLSIFFFKFECLV